MPTADIFPLEQLIFVQTELEIMRTCQKFLTTQSDWYGAILNYREKIVSGVHQGSKKKIIEVIVSFFRCCDFSGEEGDFFFVGQKNSRGFRAGEGQGVFTQPFKFFNVTWIFSAGVA